MRAVRDEPTEPSPTAGELGRPLQKGTSRLFIKAVSFTSFLQMRIPPCSFLSSIPNLRYLLGDLRVARCG